MKPGEIITKNEQIDLNKDTQVTEARKGDREFEALLASVQGKMKISRPSDSKTEFVIE